VRHLADGELYARGAATLLASWEEYARASPGAALLRLRGVAAAVFPHEPERGVYNNALLESDLGTSERTTAVDAMEAAYSAAGVERYAAWVHESDEATRRELSARGYTLDQSTRAMGMSLDDIALAREWDSRDEREAALLRYLKAVVAESGTPPMHLHEEAREAGWTDEQILEAIAYASLETFTAMVNVAGEVPVDGSDEDSRTRKLRAA